ncbi:hypothetical protein XH94_06505 [Bradyrhizobium zhanjiangense]|uniref:Uncharacterized protein n=1 Tax=Bradyrhizobium zhanjiangense TaxID=1325107 RepID=A0A4Q0ST68_9BRAD|nr:hypothetical protein XH94_06505 [Bradyrhizobium zhanjiangense]
MLDVLGRPTFADWLHADPGAAAEQPMGDDLVPGFDDRLGLGLPFECQVEVAGEDLPPRAVFKFDDVTVRMRADLHRLHRASVTTLLLTRS